MTERQLNANRINAAKSHGPITPEGRAAVRHNALKHGFTAAEIILPTVEESIEFEQFRFSFEEEYKPVGPTEQVLVEDIIVARWRLTRIRKMEPGFFAKGLHSLKLIREENYSDLSGHAHLVHVLSDDALYTDTYGKMSRYEGRFERTFYKALKELQRLQALRAAVSDSAIGTVSQNPISPDSAPQIPPPPEAARSEIRKKSEIHPPSAPEAAESETRNPKSEIRNPSRVSESPLSKPGFATLEDSSS